MLLVVAVYRLCFFRVSLLYHILPGGVKKKRICGNLAKLSEKATKCTRMREKIMKKHPC